jgi:hypothetical protein
VWRRAGQELFAEGVAEPLLETPDRPLPVVGEAPEDVGCGDGPEEVEAGLERPLRRRASMMKPAPVRRWSSVICHS